MIAEIFAQPSRYQQLRENETQKEKNHAIFAPFPSLLDVKTLFMPRSKSLNLEELQALLASYQSQQIQLEFQMRQNAGIIANLEKEREALERKRAKASPAPGRKATAKRGTTARQRAAAAKTAGTATTARTVKAAGGSKKAAATRGTTKAKTGAKATGTAKKATKTAGTPKATPAARKATGAAKRKPAAAKAKPAAPKAKTAAAKTKTTAAKAKPAARKTKATAAKAKTAAAKTKTTAAKAKPAARKTKATAARKTPSSVATAAPVKATKADKGGYRLSDWDQVLIEAVNKARQPLKKTELDALFQGHDLAKKAKMNDEAIYTKVSRVLHKLANKRGILKKVPIEGKGFAYTLA